MPSIQAERHARELRNLLGHADVGYGAALPLDLAAMIALGDLDDLTDEVADGGLVDERRWQQLEADLDRLHHLATSA